MFSTRLRYARGLQSAGHRDFSGKPRLLGPGDGDPDQETARCQNYLQGVAIPDQAEKGDRATGQNGHMCYFLEVDFSLPDCMHWVFV
jgi:hypothetical protein